MTSLTETLPILDEAVPALPGKLEAVAREGDAFNEAAAEAVAAFHQKRQMAEGLVEQVKRALEELRDHAREDEKQVESAAGGLTSTVDQEMQEIDRAEERLHTEGTEATSALGSLETHVRQGTDRTRTAQEEARTALDALGQQVHDSQPELDAAVDQMTAAVKATQQAVTDGQAHVRQGVDALKAAMDRLLGEAQARLTQTHQYLDQIRDDQEKAVGEALQDLETRREHLEQEVGQKLDAAVKQALENELDAVMDALADAGQQVVHLESETQPLREDLASQIAEVEERVGPLEGGAEQVKVAAGKLGIAWS